MNIKTNRLLLVPSSTKYIESTLKYFNHPATARFMYNLPRDYNQTKAYLEKSELEWKEVPQTHYDFSILLGEVHIGSIDMELYNEKVAEIGWVINKDYQRKGYAFEAATALIQLAKELHLQQLIAHCDARNVASYSLMEKLGMKRKLIGKRVYKDNRGIVDEYTYELNFIEKCSD